MCTWVTVALCLHITLLINFGDLLLFPRRRRSTMVKKNFRPSHVFCFFTMFVWDGLFGDEKACIPFLTSKEYHLNSGIYITLLGGDNCSKKLINRNTLIVIKICQNTTTSAPLGTGFKCQNVNCNVTDWFNSLKVL